MKYTDILHSLQDCLHIRSDSSTAFPQALYLNSESSFVALGEKYRMSVQHFLNSKLKF